MTLAGSFEEQKESSTTFVVPPYCAQTNVILSSAKHSRNGRRECEGIIKKKTLSEIKSRIKEYIEQHALNYKKITDQEDRERTRPKSEKSNSNQSKINSNQKGAHYV